MSPARRSIKRRDWPRGLYEPRPSYYVWRHPTTGETLTIGAVPLANAKNQALQANAHVFGQRATLLEKLTGATNTMAELVADMPVGAAYNTVKTRRSMDKMIVAKIGTIACRSLTVKDCADLLNPIVKDGKLRWAQAVRSRLIAVCQRGMQNGWMTSNPAEVTEAQTVVVQRQRLSLDQFQAIYEKAPLVAAWLQDAMMLALVSGQDRSTVAAMSKSDVVGQNLMIRRSKTKVRIAIPLELRMHVVGVSLRELVSKAPKVVTRLLVHHQAPYGNAKVGSKVHPDRISHCFTEARQLAKIPDEGAPTFHEIRSLSKRLYQAQGGVDTKALLGHKTEKAANLYADTRDEAPIVVSIG